MAAGSGPLPGAAGPAVAVPAPAEDEEDLRALFGRSAALFASLVGPSHVVETANQAFHATFGGELACGLPLADLVPEAAGRRLIALLDRVYCTGEACTGT